MAYGHLNVLTHYICILPRGLTPLLRNNQIKAVILTGECLLLPPKRLLRSFLPRRVFSNSIDPPFLHETSVFHHFNLVPIYYLSSLSV